MTRRALALVIALTLTGCASGGGTAPAPSPAKISPPGGATGTLTIRYSTVRKLPAKSLRRSPRFVDPNGSTLTFTDAPPQGSTYNAIATTKVFVLPGPDGTQTATVSLVSGDSILAVTETDEIGTLLASGAVFLSATAPGSTQALTITLDMAAVGIAVTTDPRNGTDVITVSQDPANPTVWNSCAALSGPSYLLPYDAANSYLLFGSNLGVGGIPQTQISSQVADNNGTTRLATDVAGGVRVVFDTAHDAVTATLQVFDQNGNLEATAYIRYVYRGC